MRGIRGFVSDRLESGSDAFIREDFFVRARKRRAQDRSGIRGFVVTGRLRSSPYVEPGFRVTGS